MRTSLLPLRGRKPSKDRASRPALHVAAPAPDLPGRLRIADPWPAVWWTAVHGGAGATTLATGTGLGADAHGVWPFPPEGKTSNVVLVARASASGLWHATAAVDQALDEDWMPAEVRLLGVAVVAAAPGKPPRLVSDRIALLSAWTNVWTVGWTDAYLSATTPDQIGTPPPDLARLTALVTAALETPQPLATDGEAP